MQPANRRLLFLQLPLPDPDPATPAENFCYAGLYLHRALRRHPEGIYWKTEFPKPEWDDLSIPELAREIIRLRPDAVSATIYLWNIEQTLALLTAVRAEIPHVRLTSGGPEVAEDHPFLFKHPLFDAITLGEGETVFPEILKSFRTGKTADFQNVFSLHSGTYRRGRTEVPPVNLSEAVPEPDELMNCVQNRPTVYLESVRGCPLSCTYCRYHHMHEKLRSVPPETVERQVRELIRRGAREIRFVDPTFNSHPEFDELLEKLADANREKQVAFFAELRADTLTKEQADLLGKAGFTEIEIGIQSISPQVLRNIRRPAALNALKRGIGFLQQAGIKTTLDVMFGLPDQDEADVYASLEWCLEFGENTQTQCMQTLLLPGTDLRRDARALGYDADWDLPPYAVNATPRLSADAMRRIETFIDRHPALPSGARTPQFTGYRLSGLFKEQYRLDAAQIGSATPVPGRGNRRTLIIRGSDMTGHMESVASLIERCMKQDPHTLWQFVLSPGQEEPLDLFDRLIEEIKNNPAALQDRFGSVRFFNLRCSHRLFLRLQPGKKYDPDWVEAVEDLLAANFR